MPRQTLVSTLLGVLLAALPLGASADGPAINVGAMPIAGAAQAFYAQEQGFFKAAGLDVNLAVLPNGAAIVAAATSGSVDIGFGSPSPLILAHLKGLPVRFITYASLYTGPPVTSALMAAKNSAVHTGADLNGQAVAVNGLHDIGQYEVQAWVDRNGGNSETVQFVEMPYASMMEALSRGRVAAASETEPWVSMATDGARVIGNLNDIVAPRYALAGWFATNAWLAANPQLAARFIAVMQQTARWANTHPKEAGALLQRYTKVTPDVAVVVLKQLQFDDTGHADPKYLQPVVDMIAKYGKTPGFSAADLIWSR
ncbi:MAG TPA: ABC transporter substrate-binding protein [Candidatus Lustribacter sp.]|jgi:NitT/TauT family transport system substrate-binding protein|nr:ABC transporter substrate-binding protein [Candidatus Lustribacter sp.]